MGRTLSARLSAGLWAVMLATGGLADTASAAAPGAHNVVIFVADGLRYGAEAGQPGG